MHQIELFLSFFITLIIFSGKEVIKHHVTKDMPENVEAQEMEERKRKKRYGVTDSLHPPKRAMHQIHAIKKRETKYILKKT